MPPLYLLAENFPIRNKEEEDGTRELKYRTEQKEGANQEPSEQHIHNDIFSVIPFSDAYV